LRDHVEETQELGLTLAAVGTGDMAYAEEFAKEREVDFPLLVDNDLETYGIVEARSATAVGLFRPSVMGSAARAILKGNLQGKIGRAPMLLGATHVIAPDGTVPYAWINGDFSDNAPIGEVIAAVRANAKGR
jgi:peroxiredoxin